MSTRQERLARGPQCAIQHRPQTTIEVRFELLTPLFGGGVEPQKPDEITPIRGASLRGQLRFWWRATRAARYNGDLEAMREDEARLWGEGTAPGVITLRVEGRPAISKVVVDRDLDYLAFPLRPSGVRPGQFEKYETLSKVGGKVTLVVEIHARAQKLEKLDAQAEAEAALWAWQRFGGLGGRTRRGFGAISLESGAPDQAQLDAWLADSTRILRGKPPRGVPSLVGARAVVIGPTAEADKSHRRLARAYRDFRQGVGGGRNPGQQSKRPGRSRWPEPEHLRTLTGQSDPKYGERFVSVDKAPRAQLGMPIIMHFQSQRDPGPITIKLASHDRLASPIIIRPIGSKSSAVGVALLLGNRPDLDKMGVVAAQERQAPQNVRVKLSTQEARKVKPLDGQPDPCLAFLDYAKNK